MEAAVAMKASAIISFGVAGRQGERVGTVLAKCLLNEADDNGWSIYLETQERRSTNLYARLGFKMLQDGILRARIGT